ncbi:asparagine synthase-related protein [Allonocardiopsis opalescens]|uniref:asparagine synthase-related protein n=1 Tax=Allonocardiopsis opalescens TaxID=1144618 RepID=UPI0011B1FAB3|nr:asparagine synthase-related protein [Allonocardiopsis opalescens]
MVLPDSPGGAAVPVAAALLEAAEGPAGVSVIPHASGRPWIVGRWPVGAVTWAVAGRRRAAVFGPSSATEEWLRRALDGATTVAGFDTPVAGLAGGFHLIASIDDRIRVQGSLSTARQVFFADIAGTPVAADRPQTLAALIGGAPRPELLAGRLIAPWVPWPLNEECLWKGVEALPAGCYLEMSVGRGCRAVRWWTPPDPDVPLAAGAERVRTALNDAVAVRTQGRRTVSADLSGGMDSTSLCFLAAGSVPRLVTTRWEAADPADEDRDWADRAAVELPGSEHLVLLRGTAPTWFEGLSAPDPDTEAPFAWIRTRSRLVHMARQVAAQGSTLHLTGHGGDELFLANPLYLHTLVRTHRLGALRYLRAYRAMYRWRLGPTLPALLRDESFGAWLSALAERLTDPIREVGAAPSFGWGIGYRLPPWATPDAVDATRALLRETAQTAPEPLSRLRAQHAALQDVRLCGDTLRRVDRLTSRHGVSWHAPFVDDRVVEAALAIRFEDVAMPDRYKPALVEAMRGTVPDAVLGRRTKSEYSAEAYDSLRRHRDELLGLCEDMRLARLGLVDADALRSTLLALPPSSFTLMPLVATFACEVWLRAVPIGGS